MRTITTDRDVRSRATSAARISAVAAAATLAGLALLGSGHPSGFIVTVAALAVLYWQMNRYLTLRELDCVRDVTLAEIAEVMPVLGDATYQSFKQAVAAPDPHGSHLLRAGASWRVISNAGIADIVLSGVTMVPDLHEIGHPAHLVDPTVRIGELKRMPIEGEVWLVARDGAPPLGVSRATLSRTIARVHRDENDPSSSSRSMPPAVRA